MAGKVQRGKGIAADSEPFSPQQKEKMITHAKALAEPLCQAEGMELVHVEYQREAGGRTLRIYIDKPGGVGLDDCVRISRQLSDLLDVYIENNDSYRLEISSPGPDRPLGKKHDFERFKGGRVKIRTAQPVEGQKNFTGVLLGLTDGMVNLMIKDKPIAIPYQGIRKAWLVNYNGESRC